MVWFTKKEFSKFKKSKMNWYPPGCRSVATGELFHQHEGTGQFSRENPGLVVFLYLVVMKEKQYTLSLPQNLI
jgi:hypothetical protein